MLKHTHNFAAGLSACMLIAFSLILLTVHKAKAGLAEKDKQSYISFPAGYVPPCPGPDCSHHYSSPTLTNHIRDMEQKQRDQVDSARKALEQSIKESSLRCQKQLGDNMKSAAEQKRLRDQEIARLTEPRIHPVWSKSSEIQGTYTVSGWDSKGPIVLTKNSLQRLPIVTASLKGGGREMLLHYEAVYSHLRFIRFAIRPNEAGDVFHVYPEGSDKEIENIVMVAERVPKQIKHYTVNVTDQLRKGKELIILLPDPEYRGIKQPVHIIYFIP